MERAPSVIAAALVAILTTVDAQQSTPAREGVVVAGQSVVRGRVQAATGRPLPRATVALLGPPGWKRVVTSNEDGDYEFTDIGPGRYRLTADRAGYVTGVYGIAPDSSSDVAPDLVVGRNEIVEHADVTLAFGAVIDGRVVDENGQPLPRVRVEAMKVGPTYVSVSAANANDLGVFRITGLRTGTYIVKASFPTPATADASYATTYVPGVTDPAAATTFTITAGQRVDGVLLSVSAVPPERISRTVRCSNGQSVAGTDASVCSSIPVEAQGALSGRVIRPDGTPIRGAEVHLTGTGRTVMTTASSLGEYRIGGVPPGTFGLFATHPAFPPTVVGNRRPDDPNRGGVVELRAGRETRRDIVLNPGGSITGRVTDERGQPLPDVRVSLLEARFIDGEAVHGGGIATFLAPTDALGEFRIAGVLPGRYVLVATSRDVWPGRNRNEKRRFQTAFYPTEPTDFAQAIDVGAGDTIEGITIAMVSAPAGTIVGRVLDQSGGPQPSIDVQLHFGWPASPPSLGIMTRAQSQPDGTFEMRDVPAGDYILSAAGVAPHTITVRPGGPDNPLEIRLRDGGTIRGVVVSDSGEPPPFATGGVRVAIVSPGNPGPAIRLPTVLLHPDWSFSIVDVRLPQLLRLTGLPEGYAVSAVTRDGENLTDRTIEASGDVPIEGVRIVVTHATGAVAGRVMRNANAAAPDALVIVFAADPAKWASGTRHVRTTYTNDRGDFEVRGLLPGSYLAIAPQNTMLGEWQNPDYLRRVMRSATRTVVPANGTARDLQLTLMPSKRVR